MLELLMILMDIVEESVCDEKLPELLDNLQEVLVTCSRFTGGGGGGRVPLVWI